MKAVTQECNLQCHDVCCIFAARGTGDPHYASFDDKTFDFQGLGDFVDLELLSDNGNIMYQIQSRLYQNPRWRRATVHSAIALGEPGKLGFEVKRMLITTTDMINVM